MTRRGLMASASALVPWVREPRDIAAGLRSIVLDIRGRGPCTLYDGWVTPEPLPVDPAADIYTRFWHADDMDLILHGTRVEVDGRRVPLHEVFIDGEGVSWWPR